MPRMMTWIGRSGSAISFSLFSSCVVRDAVVVVVVAVGHQHDRVDPARVPVLLHRLVRGQHRVVEAGVAGRLGRDRAQRRQHLRCAAPTAARSAAAAGSRCCRPAWWRTSTGRPPTSRRTAPGPAAPRPRVTWPRVAPPAVGTCCSIEPEMSMTASIRAGRSPRPGGQRPSTAAGRAPAGAAAGSPAAPRHARERRRPAVRRSRAPTCRPAPRRPARPSRSRNDSPVSASQQARRRPPALRPGRCPA